MILLPAETSAGSTITQTVLAGIHFFFINCLGRKQDIMGSLGGSQILTDSRGRK